MSARAYGASATAKGEVTSLPTMSKESLAAIIVEMIAEALDSKQSGAP